MNVLQAAFLGLIEGVTEFLPISSTAHLIVASKVIGIASPSIFFDTVVQLGALGAVIVYFWKKILTMISEACLYYGEVVCGTKRMTPSNLPMGASILIASIPVLFAGFLLRKKIEVIHESLLVIAIMSIGVGILLAIAQHIAAKNKERQVTPKNFIAMGFYQVLALIPGTSRSGIVIAGGLFEGLSFSQALEYSFFMSIPALGAAGVYELLSSLKTHPSGEILIATAIGTIISFLSALGVIHFLLTWVRKIGFMPFVIYRILFGIAILFIR